MFLCQYQRQLVTISCQIVVIPTIRVDRWRRSNCCVSYFDHLLRSDALALHFERCHNTSRLIVGTRSYIMMRPHEDFKRNVRWDLRDRDHTWFFHTLWFSLSCPASVITTRIMAPSKPSTQSLDQPTWTSSCLFYFSWNFYHYGATLVLFTKFRFVHHARGGPHPQVICLIQYVISKG